MSDPSTRALPDPDYATPDEVSHAMHAYGRKKAHLAPRDILIRGAMSGMLLGFSTSVALTAVAEGSAPWVGAMLFPLGFVLLILLGFELLTGNFALVPVAVMNGSVSGSGMLRNWSLVLIANLTGSLLYALLLYAVTTKFGHSDGGALAKVIIARAEAKTLAYAHVGVAAGVGTAFLKAVLCNWMVATGTVMAFVSRSVIGKVVCMWLPVFGFFAMGFEHSIVNMFLIPAGIMFGGSVQWSDWLLWNQITVTIGNAVGAVVLVAMVMHYSHGRRPGGVEH